MYNRTSGPVHDASWSLAGYRLWGPHSKCPTLLPLMWGQGFHYGKNVVTFFGWLCGGQKVNWQTQVNPKVCVFLATDHRDGHQQGLNLRWGPAWDVSHSWCCPGLVLLRLCVPFRKRGEVNNSSSTMSLVEPGKKLLFQLLKPSSQLD